MKIGELARRTGVTTRTLRYYEEQGLLHPERQANGYRSYPESAVLRVEQVRDLLAAGLSTRVIRVVVPCFEGSGPRLRPQVDAELAANLAREVEQMNVRIDALTRNRDAVCRFLRRATPAAPTGKE
ncbi:MerR family transcriptional regulator [Streptomyces minutiscleroticus]|uniref:MerR family transcriptional regulator n=1 Tax=Streptomyces minutiscleroticus TaxID=68238 RepID=A0A918U180_9ACTN|nr:MerR family transcriptional regulator [Streptomyces minutiscleroticus]GGX81002.1 MerR family transcriptional regulator [Streptomyces minutiscleroticus]